MTPKAKTSISFAAQVGGPEASEIFKPHFRALKQASRDLVLSRFPIAEIAFLLRVDGRFQKFGFRGLGSPHVNPSEGYISLDIGVQESDLLRLPRRAGIEIVCESVRGSVGYLVARCEEHIGGFDALEFGHVMCEVVDRYLVIVAAAE